ncbi:MAG: glycerol-3-phosphate 1-O-acyltransferase PlsY [Gammaproteobacteria bacterium]|nr:glycerol-3-phosphate 1-O-acyltransferase PlsY [Gammaproteobacteria bacterium]
MLTDVLLILGGYLVGSVATAVITCRLMGLPDPRTVGSGNPGATNVLREGGRRAAILTLAGDVLKGLVPVLVAVAFSTGSLVPALVALAAFLGHLYPVFFGFRGGKGVATAFGAMLGLSWPLALAVLATWLVVAVAFRYSSLAALCGALLAPAYAYALDAGTGELAVVTAMSILLLWRHRSNLRNLLAGREDKIGTRKPPATESEGQTLDGAGN